METVGGRWLSWLTGADLGSHRLAPDYAPLPLVGGFGLEGASGFCEAGRHEHGH